MKGAGRFRLLLICLVGAAAAILIGANVHLVTVALNSQPECVDHAKSADHGSNPTHFRAARSSC
ncbi:hypothetical protein BZU93_24995 [Salmonella enterica subsp. enterica]|nr:hypothetical protein [Salmonella enterica subsp. enterica]EBW1603894.1 hypothetical protein [Salmonella enterica subsp. enterica serovar Kottbus]EBW2353116.1 hypothetical protein [Salmonella enterica subsp. enterica serovar Enteritidis]ECI7685744.1 hypothetical protein [Salmonella enterica subsp. enterica serovar Paratyphi A]EFG8199695.1 hypothetical protein [Escherichia coli]